MCLATAKSGQITTAFIERLTLSIRHHGAAVGRCVTTLCKGEDGVQQQLALYQTYYNFSGYNGFCGSCSTPFIEPQTSKFSSQLSA